MIDIDLEKAKGQKTERSGVNIDFISPPPEQNPAYAPVVKCIGWYSGRSKESCIGMFQISCNAIIEGLKWWTFIESRKSLSCKNLLGNLRMLIEIVEKWYDLIFCSWIDDFFLQIQGW